MKRRKMSFIGFIIILSMVISLLPMNVLTAEDAKEYTITLRQTENGTVTFSKSTAMEGETITLTVVPDEGYILQGTLQANGAANKLDKNGENSYILTMPARNVTITAKFKKAGDTPPPGEYSITVVSVGNGTATANYQTAPAGTGIFVTVAPDEGYKLISITQKGNAYPEHPIGPYGNNLYVFTMPFDNVIVTAVFGIDTENPPPPTEYNITVEATSGGTASASVEKAVKDTEVTLTATPNSGYKFVRWESAEVTVTDNKFTMPEKDVTVKAVFEELPPPPPTEYSVTVEATSGGTASASVEKAVKDTEVTLTATPNSGYKFVRWESAEVTVTDNKFTMLEKDVTVKAVFEELPPPPPTEYNVNLQNTGEGVVEASADKAAEGTKVILTASPKPGSRFVRWECAEITITANADGTYSFTMPAKNVTITGVFEQKIRSIYGISISNTGEGVVEASTETATAGTVITITAEPKPGNRFTGWASDEITDFTKVDDKTFTFTMPAGDVEITGSFEPLPPPPTEYNVTVEATSGGTASANVEKAVKDTEVTLTATPNSGYKFVKWESLEVTVTDNKFTMPEKDVTVKAVFELMPPTEYNVTVEATTGGTASASVEKAVKDTEVTLTATPNSGYKFVRWESADVTVTDNKFTMPNKDVTIKAIFKKKSTGGGTATVTTELVDPTIEVIPSEKTDPIDNKTTALSTENPSTGDSNTVVYVALFLAMISGLYLLVSAKRVAEQ